ncbi:VOC family protein [Nesterenkonia ebinurensis]|uniref:VOC family protein n=1 Tax=Nesterenkonia ebinurensis TaxID=2608252 RepID=UPI00123C95C9|nr:VOC family protein [Nesterenkonia ebinurensis]
MRWNPLVPEMLVRDFSVSMGFYVQGVGFSIVFTRDSPRFAYLDLAGAQLMIEEDHDRAWVVGSLLAPRGRGLNVQIEVPNVYAVRERLTSQGFEPFRDIHQSWYDTAEGREGQYEYLVQDPDGYLIRLVEII